LAEASIFSNLAAVATWHAGCEIKGMNLMLILSAVQILITVVALVRESGEDARFAGDKLGYRS